ncbi:MAG: amino acid permease, partial [Oscillospiraceae bacterium]|nr:amino acid permease [Oscillospiraceae bacterium]
MNSTENKNSRHLRRALGLFSGVSLVAGLTIGSGIYYLGNYVLQRTNMSLGMALICWIVGGVVSILGGLCFAELGAEMPVTGGLTTYLSKAYHPALGFVNGFSAFLLTASGSIAALALAAGNAVNGMAGGVLSLWTVKCVAIGLIVLFTVLNLRGIKGAAIFQNLSMIVRFLPLALVIVLGLLFGQQNPDLSPATAFTEGQSVTAASVIKMVGFATFASLWAYEGWTELNIVAGEMKRPRKDIPLAIILSMGAITLIYTLFNLAIYRILPHSEIVSVIEANEDSYLGQIAAERIMGSAGKWIVLIGMFAGIVGIVNGDVMVFPRTYYAMAKGGFFFRKMGEINEKGV